MKLIDDDFLLLGFVEPTSKNEGTICSETSAQLCRRVGRRPRVRERELGTLFHWFSQRTNGKRAFEAECICRLVRRERKPFLTFLILDELICQSDHISWVIYSNSLFLIEQINITMIHHQASLTSYQKDLLFAFVFSGVDRLSFFYVPFSSHNLTIIWTDRNNSNTNHE